MSWAGAARFLLVAFFGLLGMSLLLFLTFVIPAIRTSDDDAEEFRWQLDYLTDGIRYDLANFAYGLLVLAVWLSLPKNMPESLSVSVASACAVGYVLYFLALGKWWFADDRALGVAIMFLGAYALCAAMVGVGWTIACFLTPINDASVL